MFQFLSLTGPKFPEYWSAWTQRSHGSHVQVTCLLMTEVVGLGPHKNAIGIQCTETSDLLLCTRQKPGYRGCTIVTSSESRLLVPLEHEFHSGVSLCFAAAQLQRGLAFYSGKSQNEECAERRLHRSFSPRSPDTKLFFHQPQGILKFHREPRT